MASIRRPAIPALLGSAAQAADTRHSGPRKLQKSSSRVREPIGGSAGAAAAGGFAMLRLFRQLRERKGPGGFTEVIDEDDLALCKGSIVGEAAAQGALFAERLAKAKQKIGRAHV